MALADADMKDTAVPVLCSNGVYGDPGMLFANW